MTCRCGAAIKAGVSPTQPRGARTHPSEPASDLQPLMLRVNVSINAAATITITI